jgi:hypothetical protein
MGSRAVELTNISGKEFDLCVIGGACALEAKTLRSLSLCSQTIGGLRKKSTSRVMQESWVSSPEKH